jgi:Tfp pilus assembly protein PilO
VITVDKTRLWIIGSVLAMVVVAALGWVLGIQPQLDQSAAADAQTLEVDSTNAASQAALNKLKHDSGSLSDLKSQLAAVATSIPADAQTPAFMDELTSLAAANGLTVIASQITDGAGFVPPANPAAPPAATAASGSGSTATPTPSPSATPAPTPKPAPTAVPGMPPAVSPLVTPDDFTVIPVSVTVRGDYAKIVAFVEAAQKGQRLFLVNGIDIGPAANGPGFDGKVSGLIYVLTTGTGTAPAK